MIPYEPYSWWPMTHWPYGLEGRLGAEYRLIPLSAFEPARLVRHMAAGGGLRVDRFARKIAAGIVDWFVLMRRRAA